MFSRDGKLLKRLIRGGPLNGPWGVALAPSNWGAFSGDLLVGNEDGGQINAFDPASGQFQGTVSGENGEPIAHDGLWGIAFGNGVIGTPETLIIVAGVDEYVHGIIEGITPRTRHVGRHGPGRRDWLPGPAGPVIPVVPSVHHPPRPGRILEHGRGGDHDHVASGCAVAEVRRTEPVDLDDLVQR